MGLLWQSVEETIWEMQQETDLKGPIMDLKNDTKTLTIELNN